MFHGLGLILASKDLDNVVKNIKMCNTNMTPWAYRKDSTSSAIKWVAGIDFQLSKGDHLYLICKDDGNAQKK